MTPISMMVGVPRVVPGVKIVNPMGNEEMAPEAEQRLRREIATSALHALQTDVREPTLFDRHQA